MKNFIPIREILRRYDPEVLRLYYASTHYRKPIEFDEKDVEEPKRELEYLYNTLRNLKDASSKEGKESPELEDAVKETRLRFAEAINNDFNTPQALTNLYALAKKANTTASQQKIRPKTAQATIKALTELANIFGILEKQIPSEAELPDKVKDLVAKREEARSKKDWKKADEIREQIRALGFILEDTSEGPRFRKINNH